MIQNISIRPVASAGVFRIQFEPPLDPNTIATRYIKAMHFYDAKPAEISANLEPLIPQILPVELKIEAPEFPEVIRQRLEAMIPSRNGSLSLSIVR